MRSPWSKLLVLLAAFQLVGGHWASLQGVAWVRMVVEYAEDEGSLLTAVAKTFDGAHPCKLCHLVKQGRETEQKQEMVRLVLNVDAVLMTRAEVPRPLETAWEYGSRAAGAQARTVCPPTPPPLA